MLHLVWYIIVGFIAGCVAKSADGYPPENHVDYRAWPSGLNYRRHRDSSIFAAKWRKPVSSCRINRLRTWSYCGFVCLAQI
jgi:hypothetical protein